MPDPSLGKPDQSRNSLTYKDAGVDIAAGDSLVRRIKPMVATTHRSGVIGGLGGFGGLFELPVERFTRPVMVSGADGVGTKLKLAIELGIHNTVGIDLVAMCVNDILVCGAEPLWFLDYYATGQLDVDQATDVIAGIVEGCVQAGAALLGGETAEMPGMYTGKDYDLAGFAVGIVEKSEIIDGRDVAPGNQIIGLFSSGPHSNGFSLIRRLLDNQDIQANLGDSTIAESIMSPTRIYAKSIASIVAKHNVRAIAHITGGGITENIPRALPAGASAVIDLSLWEMPAIFTWLQQHGNLSGEDMLRTFNCGVGMAIIVDESESQSVIETAREAGEQACIIGHIEQADGHTTLRYLQSSRVD